MREILVDRCLGFNIVYAFLSLSLSSVCDVMDGLIDLFCRVVGTSSFKLSCRHSYLSWRAPLSRLRVSFPCVIVRGKGGCTPARSPCFIVNMFCVLRSPVSTLVPSSGGNNCRESFRPVTLLSC